MPLASPDASASVYPLTPGIGVCSVAVAGVAWTLVQRDADPAAAWPHACHTGFGAAR